MGSKEITEVRHGRCKCGHPIVRKGRFGWYHSGPRPPIGHYAEPTAVA
jgi:hypothetical protein